jgi:hypothetical protein
MLFSSIFEQSKKQRELGEEKERAAIEASKQSAEASKAGVDVSKAQAASIKQQTAHLALTQEHEQQIYGIKQRVAANQYPDTPTGRAQRVEDVSFVAATDPSMSQAVIDRLGMTADEVQQQKDLTKKIQIQGVRSGTLGLAQMGANMKLTGKQFEDFMSKGELPEKLSTPELRQEQQRAQQLSIEMMKAKADVSAAESQSGYYTAAASKLESQAKLEEAQAAALAKKGEHIGADDLLKGWQMIRDATAGKMKVSQAFKDILEKRTMQYFTGIADTDADTSAIGPTSDASPKPFMPMGGNPMLVQPDLTQMSDQQFQQYLEQFTSQK